MKMEQIIVFGLIIIATFAAWSVLTTNHFHVG